MSPSEPVHITRRATLQAAGGLAAAAVLGGLDRAAAAPLAGLRAEANSNGRA